MPLKNDICVVFGALRSGTTMLRLMIDGHPRFVCPGESDYLFDHLVPGENGTWQYDLDALAADRIFQAAHIPLPKTEEAIPALTSMIADLRGPDGGQLVLVLHRGLERLLQFAPSIPILHLIRDPRDVARSAIGMGWAGNVFYGAKTWLHTEMEWEKLAPGLSESQVLDLHYENLLRHPEDTLSQFCAFLQEDYDPAMLEFPQRSTYNAVDAALAEQWRHKHTPRELGLIEPLFGDLLTKRGYEPSGHPHIRPGLLDRIKLRGEHSYSVWRRRVARYGLRDPLTVAICWKLGAPVWARSAQRRMDTVTEQYLK
ncbi:sulfotransferase family protein [Arenibacterium sp. LLYu02]|uniref:sulfotransferase family protein n=1 Tax=Arenibacterium sp. LLYu02 TaxID=3404132 RepID=UPI003B219CA3